MNQPLQRRSVSHGGDTAQRRIDAREDREHEGECSAESIQFRSPSDAPNGV